MNPIFRLVTALSAAKKKHERRCAKCGHVQRVAARQLRETVRCERCAQTIPPPKA
jgi:ribosomal protein S27E